MRLAPQAAADAGDVGLPAGDADVPRVAEGVAAAVGPELAVAAEVGAAEGVAAVVGVGVAGAAEHAPAMSSIEPIRMGVAFIGASGRA
jgi:hypothetical protein